MIGNIRRKENASGLSYPTPLIIANLVVATLFLSVLPWAKYFVE
jgi:hypothetical protein